MNKNKQLGSFKIFRPLGYSESDHETKIYRREIERNTIELYESFETTNEVPNPKPSSVLRQIEYAEFTTPMWQEHVSKIMEEFDREPFELLTHDMVRYAVYLTTGSAFLDQELRFLKKQIGEDTLKYLLAEIHSFKHTIVEPTYKTSESRVHHLSHLTYFQEVSSKKISEFSLIYEFGGGYGGMTALLKRLNPSATIVVIDLPPMLEIQYFYLFPEFDGKINLLNSPEAKIKTGQINLCPINFTASLTNNAPDLFVATWSLSEANQHTQTTVVEGLDMFKAKYVLYGFRRYDKVNPRQPCSDTLKLSSNYKVIENKAAFWALNNEHNYLIAERK